MLRTVRNNWHLLEAVGANIHYGFASRGMTVIGVTGTDGKTTTATLIYHILKSEGEKVAAITTVGAFIDDTIYDIGFHVTTPSSFELQKYIKRAKDAGCKYLVLEVTSHAIDQNRIFGIHPAIVVLTNVTHEHLDYHGTFENYLNTKLRFVRQADVAVVNRDDRSFGRISNIEYQISNGKGKKQRLVTYGIRNKADITPQTFPFKTKLFGEFNVYNSLAAAAVCKQFAISDDKIKKALANFEPPAGRQNVVYPSPGSERSDFRVMVDFAHTPNAFKKLLPGLKKNTRGRLIHVFGSAGRRDATKRPMMGAISSRYSDIIILTSEDPRDEKVEEINKQIRSKIFNFLPRESFGGTQDTYSGQEFSISSEFSNDKLQNNKKYLFEIHDRKKAIELAISLAKKGDTVVITGKGHEKSMNYGKGEERWDEFEAVKHALKNLEL